MRRYFSVAILALLLTACGGTTWDKPGLTAEQWQRENHVLPAERVV